MSKDLESQTAFVLIDVKKLELDLKFCHELRKTLDLFSKQTSSAKPRKLSLEDLEKIRVGKTCDEFVFDIMGLTNEQGSKSTRSKKRATTSQPSTQLTKTKPQEKAREKRAPTPQPSASTTKKSQEQVRDRETTQLETSAPSKKTQEIKKTTAEPSTPLKKKAQGKPRETGRQKKNEKGVSCPWCKSKLFRVVDPGRWDGKRVVECAKKECCGDICFTTVPEGVMITNEDIEDRGDGVWHVRDQTRRKYTEDLISYDNGLFPLNNQIVRDKEDRILIECPGQEKLVFLI